MKKIFFRKIFPWFISALILFFPIGVFASTASEMGIKIALMIGWLFYILFIVPIGLLLGVLLEFMIKLTEFNTFVNSQAVQIGWVLVRDVANLFFVVILLAIAFSTILQYESYNYKRLLPKLLLMALLINFSKMFAGMIIDFSNVVMNFFAQPFQGAGYGTFLKGLKLDELLKLNQVAGAPQDVGEPSQLFPIIAGVIIVTIILSITLLVVLTFVVILVVRIVAFWVLIILSPLAFLMGVLPSTQRWWQRWWQELSKYAIVGPVLAFFLWLTFSLLNGQVLEKNLEGLAVGDFQNPGGTVVTDLSFLSLYIVAIVFLLTALKVSQELGVGGAGIVNAVVGSAKKNLIRYGKLAALASGVGGVAMTPGGFAAIVKGAGTQWDKAALAVGKVSPAASAGMGVMGSTVGGLASAAGATFGALPLAGKALAGGWLLNKFGKRIPGPLGAVTKPAAGAAKLAAWGVGLPLLAGAGLWAAKKGKGIPGFVGSRIATQRRVGSWARRGGRMATSSAPGVSHFGAWLQSRARRYTKEQRDKAEAKVASFHGDPTTVSQQAQFLQNRSWRSNEQDLMLDTLHHRNFATTSGRNDNRMMEYIEAQDDESLRKAPMNEFASGMSRLLNLARTSPAGSPQQQDALRLFRRLFVQGKGKLNPLGIPNLSVGPGDQIGIFDRRGRFTPTDDANLVGATGAAVNATIIGARGRIDRDGTTFQDPARTGGVLYTNFLRGGEAGKQSMDPKSRAFSDIVRDKSFGIDDNLSPEEYREKIIGLTSEEELRDKDLSREEFQTRLRQMTPQQLERLRSGDEGIPEKAVVTAESKLGKRDPDMVGKVIEPKRRRRVAERILGKKKLEKGLEAVPQEAARVSKWGADGITSLGSDQHAIGLSFESLTPLLPPELAQQLSAHTGEGAMNIPEPVKQIYAQAAAKYIGLQRKALAQTSDTDLGKTLQNMGLADHGTNPEKFKKIKEGALAKFDTAEGRLMDANFVQANALNFLNTDASSDINRRDQIRHEGGHATVEAMKRKGADLGKEWERLDPEAQKVLEERSKKKGLDDLRKDDPKRWHEEMFADYMGKASPELRELERPFAGTKLSTAEEMEYPHLQEKIDGMKIEEADIQRKIDKLSQDPKDDEKRKILQSKRDRLKKDREAMEDALPRSAGKAYEDARDKTKGVQDLLNNEDLVQLIDTNQIDDAIVKVGILLSELKKSGQLDLHTENQLQAQKAALESARGSKNGKEARQKIKAFQKTVEPTNTEYGQFVHREELQDGFKDKKKQLMDERHQLEAKRDNETDPTKRKEIERDIEHNERETEKENQAEKKLKSNRFIQYHDAVASRDTARGEMQAAEKEHGRDSEQYQKARKNYEDANDRVESFSARPGSREELLRKYKVKEGDVAPAEVSFSPEDLAAIEQALLGGVLPQFGGQETGKIAAHIATSIKQEFKLPDIENRATQVAEGNIRQLVGGTNDFSNPYSPYYMMKILKGLREGMEKLKQDSEYQKTYGKKGIAKINTALGSLGGLERTVHRIEGKYKLQSDEKDPTGAASDFQVQALMEAVNDFFNSSHAQ